MRLSRFRYASLILVFLLLAGHLAIEEPLSYFRGKTFDTYQTLSPRPGSENDSPIKLVVIDDVTLAKYGRWPWNRSIVAKLVDSIRQQGAAVIGLDLLFPEPDTGPDGGLGDNALAVALAKHPTVLAASLGNEFTNKVIPKADPSILNIVPDTLPGFTGVISSLPLFNDSASGLGIIRSTPDRDGVLRELPLVWLQSTGDGYQMWPSFALELVRLYAGVGNYAVRMQPKGFEALKIGAAILPLEPQGQALLWERKGNIPRISAAKIMDGGIDPTIKNSIIIISNNAVGLDQFHTTPSKTQRLGSEVHALIAEQILVGAFLSKPEFGLNIERLWFFVSAISIILLSRFVFRKYWLAIPLVTLVISAPLVAGFAAYLWWAELYESTQPAIGLFLVISMEAYSLYRTSEQRRSVLVQQFSQFMSPTVVKQLMEQDSEALLTGEKREITVLLMDMRNFTSTTQDLTADQMFDLINHLLSIANDEIFKYDGTVDKFMGDAVLAFWNAPVDQPDHADKGLAAAEAIVASIQANNSKLVERGLPPLQIGAALETGVCTVGNYGSSLRFDYTAIGSAMNMAARLEAATKTVGVPLIVGPGFAKRTTRNLHLVDEIPLKGFADHVPVYTTTNYAKELEAEKNDAN